MKKIKLFFLRNKERLFRFLMVFMSCIVLSFSCFCVTSSAATVYNMTFSQPQLDEYSGYLEIDTSKWGGCVVWFRAFSDTSETFSGDCDFVASVSGGKLTISLKFASTIPTQYYISGFLVNSSGYTAPLSMGGSATIVTTNMGNITNVNAYNCSLGSGLSHTSSMTFVYGADTIIVDKINAVNSVLSTINNNTALTASRLESLLAAIYASNDRLDIIYGVIDELENNTLLTANRVESLLSAVYATNQRLDIIYGLIDEEADLTRAKIDEVIQYLEAAENGAYYNPANDGTSSTVNNQQQKDDQVMQGTATGRTEANNAISGFSGLLTTTGAVFKGSVAMTKVFNLFAQSSFLAPILQISLVLGIASFVLGTSVLALGHLAHNARPSRNNKKNNSDEE